MYGGVLLHYSGVFSVQTALLNLLDTKLGYSFKKIKRLSACTENLDLYGMNLIP